MYKVLEVNVVGLQPSQAVRERTAQYQAFVCGRKLQLRAREAKYVLRAACWALAQKSCSCSSRDYDSPACKASKHSISCSAGPGSWQTHNPQIAGATKRLPPAIGIFFSLSRRLTLYLNSTDVRRNGQGFRYPVTRIREQSRNKAFQQLTNDIRAAIPELR